MFVVVCIQMLTPVHGCMLCCRAKTVRVQDARKEEVGVMSFEEARDLALRSQAG